MDFLVDGGRRHVQKENRSFYRGFEDLEKDMENSYQVELSD
jgi:hypothetical protein